MLQPLWKVMGYPKTVPDIPWWIKLEDYWLYYFWLGGRSHGVAGKSCLCWRCDPVFASQQIDEGPSNAIWFTVMTALLGVMCLAAFVILIAIVVIGMDVVFRH